MINNHTIKEILELYDLNNLTIGVLGGHSALDVCNGAKKYGFKTLAVCQRGRERTYSHYYKTRENKGCIDEIIVVDRFKEIVENEIQKRLIAKNTIFVHNRYFWVYCDFDRIENEFLVPIFGTRHLVRLEERDRPKNQFYLLKRAGIRIPKIFHTYQDIDRLVIVKAPEKERTYERGFFLASNKNDFVKKRDKLIKTGFVTKESVERAVIEEFIVGTQVNINLFYSPISKELELMGTDLRRQTNLDGLLRLPAPEQIEILKNFDPKMIETGHVACTVKESLLEKFYDLGEKFVSVTQTETPPGIIGPFALQGAIVAERGKEEVVIFDVSMRIPGSPGTRFTPYSGYLYGNCLSYGERIAMEIRKAVEVKRLAECLT